jgi:hypothetical protein
MRFFMKKNLFILYFFSKYDIPELLVYIRFVVSFTEYTQTDKAYFNALLRDKMCCCERVKTRYF